MILLFLLCAFRSGSDRYYLKKSAGLRSDGSDVLFYLKLRNTVSLVLFNLCFYFIKLLLLAFSFLPFSICFFILFTMSQQGSMSLNLFRVGLLICGVLVVHGFVFFFRLNAYLFPVRYCFVTGNFSSLKELFIFSYRCMQNNRKRVFRRKLAFIPWFISCIFLLPIGFVRSYYHQSMADIAADLIEKHLQKA